MTALLGLGTALLIMLPPPQLSCPAPSVVASARHSIGEGKSWTAWLEPPAEGRLVVEVEASRSQDDIDLCLHTGETVFEARSHSGREQLLLSEPRGPIRIEVHGPKATRFNLRIVNLVKPQTLGPEGRELSLEPLQAGFWKLEPYDRAPRLLRLAVDTGDADWRLYDARGALIGVGEREGAERAWLPPAGDVYAVVLPRNGAARGRIAVHTSSRYRSPLREYLAALGKTPEQREALLALSEHPDFLRIVSYLEGYPQGLPIDLRAKPGLTVNGIERFGAYRERVLTINPTIAPHLENVQELVDTVVHELIHAVLDVPVAPGYPFGAVVKDSLHDPRLRGYSSRRLRNGSVPSQIRAYLAAEYGPSASNPTRDFSDLNAGGQRLIVKLIRDNMKRTGHGKETLVFKNERDRIARSTK